MGNGAMPITTEKTHDFGRSTKTITTLEIAEMMKTEHWKVLRKLEGQEKDGKHVKGYVETLADNEIVVSDYFIPSVYRDSSGKENKCYNVTSLLVKKESYSLQDMLNAFMIWKNVKRWYVKKAKNLHFQKLPKRLS